MIRWECVDDKFFFFFQTVNMKILKFNVLSGKLLAMSMIEVKFIIVNHMGESFNRYWACEL